MKLNSKNRKVKKELKSNETVHLKKNFYINCFLYLNVPFYLEFRK